MHFQNTFKNKNACLKLELHISYYEIFKDKNACLKIKTSYLILCKYLKFQKRTSIFFFLILTQSMHFKK